MQTSGTLRVLLEPGGSGAAHMRRDAALLRSHGPGSPVTLRLYTWSPPAVSLGYMQRPEECLDLAACAAAGIDVVQRPTGGRAVLHWEEVTYALVASTQEPRFGSSLRSSHRIVGEALVAALARLGIPAQLARPRRDAAGRLGQPPCFVAAGRAEILVGGRKLVGSAQRRTARAFLQHGSLLLGPAHLGVVPLLRPTGPQAQSAAAMRRRLQGSTTHVQELLGRLPSFDEMAAALVQGFCGRLQLQAAVERLQSS